VAQTFLSARTEVTLRRPDRNVLLDLRDPLDGAAAERTLEVGELDDRDRRDGVPAHRAVRFHLDARRLQEDVYAGRVAQLLPELGAARLQAAAAHSFRDLGQGLTLRQTGVAFRDAFVHRLDVRHHRHDDLRFDLRLQQLLGRDVAPRGFGFDQLRGDQILEDAAADVEG